MSEERKFNPKLFMGICMGAGGVGGLIAKTYLALEGTEIKPFWWWAISTIVLGVGLLLIYRSWADRRDLRARIDRAAAATDLRRGQRGVEVGELEDRQQP